MRVLLLAVLLVSVTLVQPEEISAGVKIVYYARRYCNEEIEESFVNFTVIDISDNKVTVEVISSADWMKWLTGTYTVNYNGLIVKGKYKGTHFPLWINKVSPSIEILGHRYNYSGKKVIDSQQVFVYSTRNRLIAFRTSDLIMLTMGVRIKENSITNCTIVLVLYTIEGPSTTTLVDAVKGMIGTVEKYSLLIALFILIMSLIIKREILKR